MASFVLKAPFQQSKPEIIFVADQSSSMRTYFRSSYCLSESYTEP